jgi:hypothetical protein
MGLIDLVNNLECNFAQNRGLKGILAMINKIGLMKKLRSVTLRSLYIQLTYDLKLSTSRLCGFTARTIPAFCLHGIKLKDPKMTLLTYDLRGMRAMNVTLEKGSRRFLLFCRSVRRTRRISGRELISYFLL